MVLNGAGGNIELPCFSEAVGPTKIMPEEAIEFLHLVIDNRVIVNMAGETVAVQYLEALERKRFVCT